MKKNLENQPPFVEIARTIIKESGDAPAYSLSVEKLAIINKYCNWEALQTKENSEDQTETIRNYTKKEVSQIFRISLPTVDKYSKLGIFEAIRVGNRVLFSSESVSRALKEIPNQRLRRANS